PLGFMKIIRDRTSQVLALRSKSEFVTVASHQLRGPVTDISWALQSLNNATGLDDTNKSILANAVGASDNLLRRIEDLLNIAKMEDGQFGYKFEDADISAFIAKALADILPAAQKAGIKIYFDRPQDDLPHVFIDPKRLSLVVTNLIENAIRYNVENGEVTVKVDKMQDKPYVVVSVKDTGIGIPPESMEKLFNKFYRADNAMKLQTEGSGLGLYIAKGIVNAHGGQIWAESELNRGTTISFALPTDPNLVPKNEVGAEDLF
ncbi:MAG TPA: HAMP domain-containing sensor histidine kinase, partial [Candidatus Paceibacterota bacterium]